MLKRSLQFTSWLLMTVVSCHTWAAAETADASNALVGGSGVSTGQVFTVLAGLAFVLLLVFGCGWLVKRFSGMSGTGGGTIKVVSVLPVGTRERLALVDVGGQQLLLGVTAQQITTLHTFDEPVADAAESKNNSEFAQKLHQLMSRQ